MKICKDSNVKIKVVHVAAFCLLLTCVTGCEKKRAETKTETTEANSSWFIDTSNDPMTDKKTVFGYAPSSTGNERLIFSCHKEQGQMIMDFYVKTADYIGIKKYAGVNYRFDKDQSYSSTWEMNKNEVAIKDENKLKELPFIFTQMKMASKFTIQFLDCRMTR